MKPVVKFAGYLYTVYAFLLFVVLLLLVFLLAFIASFLGRIKGGNFIYRICSYWADIWLPMIGIRAKRLYAAPHNSSRQFIFVANHISYMDVPMFVKAIRQPVRALGKYEMSKLPVFGFLYRNAAVMVDRSNTENRAKSVMVLKSVLRKGISIFIFPEGTFNTTGQPLKAFFDGAFRIAIETKTPIKPVIFPDTFNRLHYNSVFSLTPGICRAVYLEEVGVEGLGPEDVAKLKNRVVAIMETALLQYRERGAENVTGAASRFEQ
jgi:1-acyl-sn-glycerol-3-phosphate acyltransferase